jgi:hypothetical protein
VPLEAGRALYARARGVKVMLETGGGHNRAGFAPFDDLQLALARLWPAGEVERFSETR